MGIDRVGHSNIVSGAIRPVHMGSALGGIAGSTNLPRFKHLWPLATAWGATGDTGDVTITHETTGAQYGTTVLKVVMADKGGAANATVINLTGTLQDNITVRGPIGIWIKVDDWANVQSMYFRLLESTADADYQTATLCFNHVTNTYGWKNATWQFFWIPQWAFLAGGSATNWGEGTFTKTISKVYLSITTEDDATLEVELGDIVEVTEPKGIVTLWVDGSDDDTMSQVRETWSAKGYPFVYTMSVNLVSTDPSWAILQDIQNNTGNYAGFSALNDVVPHGYNAAGALTAGTTGANFEARQRRCMDLMAENGLYRGRTFASWLSGQGWCDTGDGWPSAYLAAMGVLAARATTYSELYNATDKFPAAGIRPYPIADGLANCTLSSNCPLTSIHVMDPYNLPHVEFNKTGDASDAAHGTRLETTVNDAIGHRCWMHGFIHQIYASSDPGGNNIKRTAWDTFVAAVDAGVAAGTLEVLSLSEVLNRSLFRPGAFRVAGGQMNRIDGDGTALRSM